MRTSTAAWTAALAVMSLQGPFTTAEAAPAQDYAERERPKYYFPKEVKRERAYSNTTETETRGPRKYTKTSTAAPLSETTQPPAGVASSEAAGGEAEVTSSTASPSWVPKFDPLAWYSSMMGAGSIPAGSDSVMTSTITTTWQSPIPLTQTYTVTWTETSSPSSSAAALTSSSSVVAPSSSQPSVVVEPTPSTTPEVSPTTTSTSTSVVVPSEASEAAPPAETYGTAPSANSPPVVVQPTVPGSSTEAEVSAYTEPEVEESSTRVRSRKHKQSTTDVDEPTAAETTTRRHGRPSGGSPSDVEPTTIVQPTPYTPKTTATSLLEPSIAEPSTDVEPSTDAEPTTRESTTRRHRRPSGASPSDDEPTVIVQPTPYTPKTRPTSPSSPSVIEQPTTYQSEIVSPSSYAIISSRSFSFPANTTSYMPTAPLSSSSSSLSSSSPVASSSSSSDRDWLGVLPTSLGLPTSILQPTIPHSEKLSATSQAGESPSRHHAGRPGRPTDVDQPNRPGHSTDATSAGLPESIVQPTVKSSTVEDEITTARVPSSGGPLGPIVLPTPHSSESTRTRHRGDHTSPGAEHTRTRQSPGQSRPTGWPFDEPLLSGGLLPSHSEPSPTRRASSTSADESSSSSSPAVPIIVPLPTDDSTASGQTTRPAAEGPLASLGLTGLPGSLGLPTPTSGTQPRPSDSTEGGEGEGTGRPDFNPFSNLGITGLPTSLGQPTGIASSALPLGTGANDSNTERPGRPGRPDFGPIRPGQSSGSDDDLSILPTLPLTLPTTLPLESNGNETAGVLPIPLTPNASETTKTDSESSETGVAGILPIPLTTDASAGNDSEPSETGLAGVLPLTTPTVSLPHLSGAITSALSGVNSDIGSLLTTDTGATPTPVAGITTTPSELASIASSLSDQLSSIVATATNPEVSPSLASEYSSVLSSAASSLASEASLTDKIPVETTPLPATPGTTIGTPAPTGGENTTPSYTLSTSTGTDGPTAIPVPNTTPTTTTPTTEQISSSADTPSETYGSQTTPSDGSTVSTSIPLSTGATVPVATSDTSSDASDPPAVPSGYSTPSTVDSQTATPETTPVSSQNVTAPSSPEPTTPTIVPGTTKETSIEPTGTNTETHYDLPSTWNFAPTTPAVTPESSGTLAVATSSTGSSGPSGIPTYMPRLIQPPGGMPPAPANGTLIQLALNYGLNFPFVVREQDSASQIFAYLPQGIAYGLGISHDKVKMNALMPYDTSRSLQFITTLAQAYVPSEMVDQLELDLHNPRSGVYNNPDEMIRTLMGMINPTFPILPGASMDGSDSSSADNPAATGGPSSNQGAPIGGDTGESRPVRGSSVGIGVGAVCGAAAYAAAMVYIARRYKKKRASHQRASSVPTAGEMSENGRGGMGGFFMAGGRGSSAIGSDSTGSRYSGHSSNGRSVREQGISAPVMSENSLGWN